MSRPITMKEAYQIAIETRRKYDQQWQDYMKTEDFTGESSNGRTGAFGTSNVGSNPASPTNLKNHNKKPPKSNLSNSNHKKQDGELVATVYVTHEQIQFAKHDPFLEVKRTTEMLDKKFGRGNVTHTFRWDSVKLVEVHEWRLSPNYIHVNFRYMKPLPYKIQASKPFFFSNGTV